jgi:phosphatidylglycerophosphate synthase
MLDPLARRIIDPPLTRAGTWLAARGATANAVTALGLVIGMAAAGAIALGQFALALGLIIISRIADGLDGAVARARGPTDLGGYFDILADFAFYAAIPVAFGLADPANTLPALVLVASFVMSGTSFLAFAAIAAKRGLETAARGRKSFFHAGGLAEGSETIAAFSLMCLFPQSFGLIAWIFAALCLVTAAGRCLDAIRTFHEPA